VIHPTQGHWDASVRIGPNLCLTSSRDILSAIGSGQGPDDAALVLGYAGWGPGQLEDELADNVWLTAPADPDILFKVPAEKRWEAAIRSLGIDPAHLSSDVGRA
jgi:putative transcriptional regulator